MHCSACHGVGAVGGGVLPDLRFLRPEARAGFAEIVLYGALRERGMPGFGSTFDRHGADAGQPLQVGHRHAGDLGTVHGRQAHGVLHRHGRVPRSAQRHENPLDHGSALRTDVRF